MKKIFKHLKIVFIAMVLLCSCSGFNFMASASFSDPQPSVQTTGRVEKTLPNYSGGFLCFPDESIQVISIGPDDKDWKNKFDEYDCYYSPYVFEVDSQNPYYSSYDGVLYTKDHTKLLNTCPRKTDIQFHPKLQTIGEHAFRYTESKKLVLPWGVTTIEKNNFWEQTHTGVIIIPDTLIHLDSSSRYVQCSYLVVSKNNVQIQEDIMETYDNDPRLGGVAQRPQGADESWNFYDCYGITPNSLKTFQNGKTYYFDQNCKMAKGWKQASGNWYYFNDYGAAVVKIWLKSGNKWYFMQADGTMATNKWIQWYNKWYYVGSDGAMYANRYTPDGYWVNGSGVWMK